MTDPADTLIRNLVAAGVMRHFETETQLLSILVTENTNQELTLAFIDPAWFERETPAFWGKILGEALVTRVWIAEPVSGSWLAEGVLVHTIDAQESDTAFYRDASWEDDADGACREHPMATMLRPGVASEDFQTDAGIGKGIALLRLLGDCAANHHWLIASMLGRQSGEPGDVEWIRYIEDDEAEEILRNASTSLQAAKDRAQAEPAPELLQIATHVLQSASVLEKADAMNLWLSIVVLERDHGFTLAFLDRRWTAEAHTAAWSETLQRLGVKTALIVEPADLRWSDGQMIFYGFTDVGARIGCMNAEGVPPVPDTRIPKHHPYCWMLTTNAERIEPHSLQADRAHVLQLALEAADTGNEWFVRQAFDEDIADSQFHVGKYIADSELDEFRLN